MSQISQKSFEDGETISVRCSKLPFLLSNGQNDAVCHGFVITRAKKEAPATTTSALVLHPLFEQILYIPLIVFSFLHQPTDTVCLVPLLQKLGKRPIECGLPPLDHAAILLHGICCFADGQPLGKAFPEEIGVVVEHRFERLLGKCEILTHGLICLAVGYADVLLPFPDEFVSPQIHPVVFTDVLGVFIVGSAATDGALRVLVINISEGLALGLRKAVLIHFADGAFVDLAPGLTDVFIPQHTIHLDLLAEGGVPNEVVMLPMLLIDDEADNASVNTKSEDDSPAAINACIRQLLHEFNQASYLGITATPFANIFINPETEDEMIGDDLFPRDFIYSLAPPTNYIGADKIFGDATEKFSDVLIPLRREEMDLFFPFTHKKTLEVDALPPSMYEAIAYFLLFNAIRDLRGDYTEHRSMMIHVSRFTDVQNRIAEAVNEWLVQVKSDVQNYAALDDEKREQIASLRYLHKVWMKHQLEKISKTNWDDICSNYLNRAIAPIAVRAVNQRTGATSLDYFNHKEDGLRVIAVGGNSLSRGLTLEGLGVSYFYRKSQMYDTLLQMGRWFGYRPNYEDLFRIWMAEEAIDWYGYITRAANELKDEIAKMKLANQTPREFGLKVRQDPNSLIATARNKMRSATQVSRPVTVSGKLLETPRLKANPAVLKANEAAFKEFVDHLGSAGTRDFSVKPYYWRGVSKELVVQLLLDFETHPWHLAFQGRALAEYIDEKMDNETWDVALITDGEGSEYRSGLKCGSEVLPIKATERRSVIADDKMIRISGTKVKVGSGGCTRVGLTKEQIETARKRFKEQNGDKHMSDSAYLIRERSPLLMLHIIETDLDKVESTNREVPPYLFALGVGFPDTGAGIRTANYMVNMVELKNWMDPDEEEDE